MNVRTPIFAFAAIVTPAAILQADDAPAVNAFNHIVVIYQENHSFDNLYGLWGEVNGHRVNGLPNADAPHTKQVQADGETPYTCLLQNDVNLTSPSPLPATCSVQSRRLYFRDGHNLSGNGRVCAKWNRKRQRESRRLHQRPSPSIL
jgi:phospholipase C